VALPSVRWAPACLSPLEVPDPAPSDWVVEAEADADGLFPFALGDGEADGFPAWAVPVVVAVAPAAYRPPCRSRRRAAGAR
jgi:hypothetical protein